jgi:hypothetical protein
MVQSISMEFISTRFVWKEEKNLLFALPGAAADR